MTYGSQAAPDSPSPENMLMMNLSKTELSEKLRREKSKQAIALALEGRWEVAIDVNLGILRFIPEDVEALNRLGKAFLELGRYTEATEAFEKASRLAPYNSISKKNLERLAHLQKAAPRPNHRKVVTPILFIEESGKSGVTGLRNPAPSHVIVKMAPGDPVKLVCKNHSLTVENSQDEYLGQIEPKLGIRLIRLMSGGNRYDAAITSVNRQEVSAIIWETYRHPDLASICSFPTKGKDDHKLYLRDDLLRYDIDTEMESDEDAPDWRTRYSDGSELSEAEPAEAIFVVKPVKRDQDEDENGEEE